MKIALIGYGKMGRMIHDIAESRSHTISTIIDPSVGKDLAPEKLSGADVAIEFSKPNSAFSNYASCFKAGLPVVSGTTGWLDRWNELEEMVARTNGGFFYSSNFSLGVNLFYKLNSELSRLMAPHSEYQPHITEIHHTQKLDAPSGTALSLLEPLLKNLDEKTGHKLNSIGASSEIPVFAIREGKVTGTHQVDYVSEVDKISIRHEAFSRKGFALGAVLAAEYMLNKTGIHSMDDLLTV